MLGLKPTLATVVIIRSARPSGMCTLSLLANREALTKAGGTPAGDLANMSKSSVACSRVKCS